MIYSFLNTSIYFLITFTLHLIARFVAYSKGNLMILNSINKNKTKSLRFDVEERYTGSESLQV